MNEAGTVVGPHADGVMEQAVDDELILFNPGTETYFTLNRSAREVWDLADGTRSLPEIAAELGERYGMNATDLEADVSGIIDSFREAGLL